MLGPSLKLPTLFGVVKPRNSELSYMRDSCRVKAMLATSCLMYSSHRSVRFTEVILRLAVGDLLMKLLVLCLICTQRTWGAIWCLDLGLFLD